MHIDYRPAWIMTLTSDELSLIGRALCGKLNNEEEKKAALALNISMCHSRLNRCDEVMDVADKALRGAWKQVGPEQEAALRLQYETKAKGKDQAHVHLPPHAGAQ